MSTLDLEQTNLPVTFEVQSDFLSDKFVKVRMYICHTGKNRNGTSFTISAYQEAASSLPYCPILAYVVFDENNEPQFEGHAMHLEGYKDGQRVIYDEVPIGVIPENCNYAIETRNGLNYVCADAYIWKEYSNYAMDIIERDRIIPLSMEIGVQELQYDKAEDVYAVTKFRFKGISCCPDMDELGMEGAHATVVPHHFTLARASKLMDQLKEALRIEFTLGEKGATSLEENMETQAETIVESAPEDTTETTPAENTITPDAEEPAVLAAESEETAVVETSVETPVKTLEGTLEVPVCSTESYSLTSHLFESLSEALSVHVSVIDGQAYSRYCFEDVDVANSKLYVFDMEDGNVYAVSYKLDGDNVILGSDFKRQIVQYRDYQDGMPVPLPSAVGAYTQKYLKGMGLKDRDSISKELNELRTFKADVELKEKLENIKAVFSNFSDLEKSEEFEKLKAEAQNYTISELEKECYALRGKLFAPSAYTKTGRSRDARVSLPKLDQNRASSGPIAIIEKYKRG